MSIASHAGAWGALAPPDNSGSGCVRAARDPIAPRPVRAIHASICHSKRIGGFGLEGVVGARETFRMASIYGLARPHHPRSKYFFLCVLTSCVTVVTIAP